MPSRDLGHDRSRRKRLLENPSLLVGRPPTSAPRPRENLDPTRGARLRLKLMVKHNHVPISKSEIGICQLTDRTGRRRQNSAYASGARHWNELTA